MATYNTTGSRAGMPTNIPAYSTSKTSTTSKPQTYNGMPSDIESMLKKQQQQKQSTQTYNGMPSNVESMLNKGWTPTKPTTTSYNTANTSSSNNASSMGGIGGSSQEAYQQDYSQPIIYNDNSQLIVDYLTQMDEARRKSNENLMAKIRENFDSYKQMLEAQKESENTRADETAAQRRQIAQDMYNKSMGLLDDNYASQLDYLKQNYDSALGQVNDNYNRNETRLNDNADQALREAYLNKMLSMRNLNQALAAQGINGGAAESTMAGMLNNYGNSRNKIETNKANNLSDLMGTRDSSLAELLQQYNSNLSNAGTDRSRYLMDIENALANNEINTVQDYQNMLSNSNSNYLNALLNATNQMNNQLYDISRSNEDTSGIQNIINMYKMQLAE